MTYLKIFFASSKLTVQLAEAYKTIEEQLAGTGDRNKYFINAVKLLDMHNGSYYFSLNPETDGRFHSSLTNFPSRLRKSCESLRECLYLHCTTVTLPL